MRIITTQCQRCGRCIAECPAHLFVRSSHAEVPQLTSSDGCLHCGHCVVVCPAQAISDEETTVSVPVPLPEKVADWESFYGLLQTRRSVRQFQEKPVPRALLEKIIAAAQLAPTATNQRKVCWTVVTDPDVIHELRNQTTHFLTSRIALLKSPIAKVLAQLFPHGAAGSNMRYLPFLKQLAEQGEQHDWILFDAPAVMVAHYDKKGGPFANPDAQLALQNATLAAVALGLGTFYTGFITVASQANRQMAKLLKFPPGHQMAGGMAVGYPAVPYFQTLRREYPETEWI